ncbi:MAG: 3-deoxy-manno-octulosonate cytidylyltransferase [Methylicorpusculum sp.]|uniref:3-deoxy-manno-octulosonate cytidylyltransferase n=1 Tax=Methylicorpusculum sp. TaxID=2713644 RepID=UPI002718DA27|nr:3-deoxy-manno-octulosonate cytidylyltransferase [Methylicorpusculum sp.]MDO8938277.1 3-deoxy-manno-octulosonate cytidylyltransferase [Methylicorpusculum sp.]MDO9239213.1 3-deoxy-manno-octulosonate cytidylyltransferase [Methylicorpusculum sp.]MDP2202127.1 3-deoxy-manno-octulosonate cytidylyltransferase [Methylicorpusculum sp.]
MSPAFKVVIPARYGSTRLPGKPLLSIAGKPMIVHVCERAQEAGADEVVVATDDTRIVDAVTRLGIKAVMTRPDHQSGTERIAEVAALAGWSGDTVVVNLQGDEPLIPPQYIRDAAYALAAQNHAGIATLAARIDDSDEIFNPNSVKVVLDKAGYALYFSRAPIPWDRAHFGAESKSMPVDSLYLRHIGLYAYTVNFLNRYCGWEASPIEAIESLEQLRILWHGDAVLVKTVDKTPEAGVDTEADLLRVEKALVTTRQL